MLEPRAELPQLQDEWQRQVGGLDQREAELHRIQLALVREQTTSFAGDLGVLRSGVDELKVKQDLAHADVQALRRSFGASLDKQAQAIREAHERLEQLLQLRCEAVHSNAIATMDEALGTHSAEFKRLDVFMQSTREACNKITHSVEEQLHQANRRQEERYEVSVRGLEAVRAGLGELELRAKGTEAEVDGARTRLEQLSSRIAACEKHGAALVELQRAQAALASDAAARYAGTAERMEKLEAALVEEARRTDKLESMGAMHAKQHVDLAAAFEKSTASASERLTALENQLTEGRLEQIQLRLTACENQGSSLRELLGQIDGKRLADADRHAKELQGLRSAFAPVPGRLGKLEAELGDARARLEQLGGSLLACEKQCVVMGDVQRAHGSSIDEIRRAFARLEAQQRQADASQEKLQAAQNQFALETKTQHGELSHVITKGLGAVGSRHTALEQSLSQLQDLVKSTAATNSQEAAGLRSSLGRLADEAAADRSEQRRRLDASEARLERQGRVMGAVRDAWRLADQPAEADAAAERPAAALPLPDAQLALAWPTTTAS